MLVWLDHQICDVNQAQTSPLNAANLSGQGVFTTLGIRRSRALWLPRHCARLRRDGAQLNLICPFDDATIENAGAQIIAANQIENGIARLTLCGSGDNRWRGNSGASLLISALPSAHAAGDIRLWLAPQRMSAQRPLCGVKSTSYAPWQWLWQQAQARGCQEAIYCDDNGNLCEGARSNLFWIADGEICTPALSCGPLPGIGRALVIEMLQRVKIEVHEIAAPGESLRAASEVFITNAVTGPRNVVSIRDEISEIFRAHNSALVRQFQEIWRLSVEDEIARSASASQV